MHERVFSKTIEHSFRGAVLKALEQPHWQKMLRHVSMSAEDIATDVVHELRVAGLIPGPNELRAPGLIHGATPTGPAVGGDSKAIERVGAAIIRAMGMQAENVARLCYHQATAYDERAFEEIAKTLDGK
jgi:hypothetical protein